MYSDFIAKFKIMLKKGKFTFYYPYSKKILKFINLLTIECLIQNYQLCNNNKYIRINLINLNSKHFIKDITYFNKNEMFNLKNINKNLLYFKFVFIVLTNKGLMTTIKAQKKNIGGRLICKIIC